MTPGTEPRRSRRDLLLRRGLPALAVLLIAAFVVLAVTRGGEDDGGGGAAAAATSATASTGAPAPTDEPAATSSVPPSPATEEPAPSVIAREGVPEASRSVEVAPADFAAPAGWSDGASIRLAEARQQTTTGTGPGERAGQPQTVFRLELTNGSDAPLDLNAVVVQATYGAAAAQASPIYDRESADFGGTLAPGETATAVYSFAIPADQLGDVTLSVDVDGYRFPAVFSGAVPV
ncbi:hypothetical protein ACI797_02285 [Geodermatophilus sp. SYSU D00691]